MKVLLWSLFFILSFVIPMLLPIHEYLAAFIVASLWIGVPAAYLYYSVSKEHNHRKKIFSPEYGNQLIPENVGKESFVEVSTDFFILYSYDFKRRSGNSWSYSHGSLFISENRDPSLSKDIDASRITRCSLDEVSSMITITYEEEYTLGLSLEGNEIPRIRRRTESIYLSEEDMKLAKSARMLLLGK